jgi:NitT/TauT family transport system substrate-binding protein
MKRSAPIAGVLLAAALAALAAWVFRPRDPAGAAAGSAEAPTLELVTSAGATTPQIPLWAAVQNDPEGRLFRLHTTLWKDSDHLQTLLLGGRGDLWVGHLEGFARARLRGAPIRVLAITGWKKFYLLSSRDDIRALEDLAGRTVYYTPPGSPAVPLLQALLPAEILASIDLTPSPPAALGLQVLRGRADIVLAPEPLVTSLMIKAPGLRTVLNMESEFARRHGGGDRLPVAGIAVREDLLDEHPERFRLLLAAMIRQAEALRAEAPAAAASLPEAFTAYIPRATVIESLARDVLDVAPAAAVRGRIALFLRTVLKGAGADGDAFLDGFLADVPGLQASDGGASDEENRRDRASFNSE